MIFFSSLLLLLLMKQVHGCTFTTRDGTFDLSNIAGKSYPFQSMTGDYYTFSFCSNAAASTKCASSVSGACAIQAHNGDCYSLGTWDTSFTLDSTNSSLSIAFKNGSPDSCKILNKPFPRSITYNFECNENEEASVVSASEPSKCEYTARVGTKYVCSDHIIHKSSSAGGLSNGSIFLICLLVFVTVYCVGGFGFNKYKRSAEGFQAPQANFWCKKLPFWVKTGCMVSWAFTVRLFLSVRAKITGVNPVNRGREDTDADGEYANLD